MFDINNSGKQIAQLRKRLGITQEELAERLSVSPQAISKWENGHSMPEISMLVELANILNVSVDEILLPQRIKFNTSNFEYILLPYAGIADFSGMAWPRSMAEPAVLAAIKLFMGLEAHRDSKERQINDDSEYILQSALTYCCFGYSWGRGICEKSLSIYGLTCKVYNNKDYTEQELIRMASDNILNGYPVVIEPEEYEDIVLATGFSNNGKVLKGIPFLNGDDNKNAVMSFKELQNFSDWYKKDFSLILICPAEGKVRVSDACKEALQEGYQLLCNNIHQFAYPLIGYGLVIYDNWYNELKNEEKHNLKKVECIYPHIFIHYENKMRLTQFLEICLCSVDGIDKDSLQKAVLKYEEIIDLCEKAMHDWLDEDAKEADNANCIRQGFKWLLQRSKELETIALRNWKSAIKNLN